MPAAIYLHIPFCKSRCSYCDFATDVYRNNDAVERYVAALCKEISGFTLPAPVRTASVRGRQDLQYKASSGNEVNSPAHASGSDIDTIYLGGGTPSLLTAKQVGKILNTIN